jgi:hypothetical protein
MTEPRKPQDRKPKAPASASEPDHPDGWDLLRPFSEVPVWDQTELLEIVKPMMADARAEGSAEDQAMSFDTRIVGQVARMLGERFVVTGRESEYLTFVSGDGALERAVNLGIAYAAQLGESEPSTAG